MLESLISGLVAGSAYALIALCVVMLYRLVGLLNFSQAAIGALGAFTTYGLATLGAPLPVAVIAGLIASAIAAGLIGWMTAKWFGDSTVTARSAMTVALLVLLLTVGFRLFGTSPQVIPSIVPVVTFEIGGVRVPLTTVVALALTVVIAASLSLILQRTDVGIRMLAMSERPTTVQLLGVNSRLLAVVVWTVTGLIAALSVLLVAPTQNPTFDTVSLLIVPGLAAALVGGFTKVWVAVASGLVIGAIEGVGAQFGPLADVRGAVPFIVIIVALIWLRRKAVWDAVR